MKDIKETSKTIARIKNVGIIDKNVLSEESDHDSGSIRVHYLSLSASSSGSADEGKKEEDNHVREEEYMHSTSIGILKSRISQITTSGGLGIVIHVTKSDKTAPLTWLSLQ